MKILAVRGKNLASLAGEFEIDFLQPPLSTAGLFAISGPTGAGKSTLLDALCLALYDRTPRLQHAAAQGVRLRDVGDETLPPQDVRNVLRRGCADGYAEVDFIGNDKQHYRSRWSVRRAHGRVDGRLQATEMSLLRLPEAQPIGGVKTEVLEHIRQRLGLSFEQFTRAVLLAQNEFSVFLKAGDDERASLLETLTGTDEYSRISMLAFERAKQEKGRLEALSSQLAVQQPLAAEQRQAIEAQKQTVERALAGDQQRQAEIEQHLQWHRQYQVLQTAEQQAQHRVEQAQAAQAQAEPRRAHVALVESLQEARPLLTECDRLQAECQRQQSQFDAAQSGLADAISRQQTAQQAQQTAQQRWDQAERDRVQILDDIGKAKTLDAEIALLLPRHRQLQHNAEQARQALAALDDELTQKRQSRDIASQELSDCEAWLQNHASLEMLSQQWPRWEVLFKQAQTAASQRDTASLELTGLEKRVLQAQTDLQAAQTLVESQRCEFESAERACKQAELAAGQFDAAALTSAHGRHQLRLEQLRQAKGSWEALGQLSATDHAHAGKLESLAEQQQDRLENLATVRQKLPALQAAHAQAAKMLDLVKLASHESVEKLRAQLQDGCECPVCGSKQHPFAHGQQPLLPELNDLEAEVAECLLQCKQAEQLDGRLSLELEQLDKQIGELQTARQTLQTQMTELQTRWQSHAQACALPVIESAEIEAWLSQQLADAEAALLQVGQDLNAMSDALARRDLTHKVLAAIEQKRQLARQQAELAQAGLNESQMGVDQAAEKLRALQSQLSQWLDELDGAFENGSWRQDWQADGESFFQSCRRQARFYLEQQTLREQLLKQIAILDTELEALVSRRLQAERQAAAALADFSAIDVEVAGKGRQRQGFLAGRSVTEAEAELERRLAAVKAELDQAVAAAHAGATGLATARQAEMQAQTLLNENQARRATAEDALAKWLTTFRQRHRAIEELDQPQLRALLQHDHLWLSQERQALQAIDKALAQALAVLDERRQQCEQHWARRASLESLADLETAHSELTTRLTGLRHQHTELVLQLRADDQRLAISAELLDKRAAQAAVHDTWSKLNALIGSADGKKFRNIAQQLTLDVLFGYANQHLKDLSRRYRLERVKDTLALQVVDQDMGDEIRSVHSLSGGESFLLSLALALGLASLSSNRVKVESLFIDEGFGSLDAETLRVAMDALDSLQALGRKVGVISHVQEMTERIGTRIEIKRIGNGLSRLNVG
ncbi:AAA family ATPase [Methylomonas rapida]|uniref:AAA family ATPase n=1 Tax=Methylomonas rapida TaxID=2963939 RepID=A0ABY7GFQ7_9GAMM|nr:AAA family ATPase [Methylomonas rapida]WAR43669.1 AAA family ATPase [Methylomonas rapida]